MVTGNVTDCSVLHVESGSYIIKNGIIGPVIEHPTFTSSSLILNVSNRSSNIFLQSYINGFTGTELILNEIYGEQPATWNVNDILHTVNFFESVSDHPGPFMQNIYSVYILVLKAPWFHFIILLGLVFRVFTTFPTSQSKVSRFRLLVKHRMALGRLRANRVSYVELLSLRNTPACLHSLEFSCGIAQARSLSAQSAGASL